MVSRTRNVQGSSRRNADSTRNAPDIYQELLTEASVASGNHIDSERPLKRRRPGTRPVIKDSTTTVAASGSNKDPDSECDSEFEDVALPSPTVQTMEKDDDENDDDAGVEFEDVNFESWLKGEDTTVQEEPKGLELNLSAYKNAQNPTKKEAERRKPITKEEKERRVQIHQTHLLCLLSHISRRNRWCNDSKVQAYLRPHLTDKMVTYLNPGTHLSQFGRTNSLKTGLEQVAAMWRASFEITERGLRRSLWAEETDHLQQVCKLEIQYRN